jgi:RNA-binding protein
MQLSEAAQHARATFRGRAPSRLDGAPARGQGWRVALSGKQRRHLRALAHPLDAVVRVGHGGLSAGLLREIDGALETHELIKVKVSSESPAEPDDLAPEIVRETRAELAQIIGRTLVLYRRRAKDPKIQLPHRKSG